MIGKIKGLLKNAALTIKTKISKSPISIEAEIKGNTLSDKTELNLDRIYKCVDESISDRELPSVLVIIDRIDTFVAGEEYDVQR